MKRLLLGAVLCAMAVNAGAGEFASVFPVDAERVWLGPDYWANRLQDWRVAGGRIECLHSGGDRNVHLLTRQLAPGTGDLTMSVRLGKLGAGRLSPGWVGFRVGSIGEWKDYRDSCRRGKGLDCGVTTDGTLFIGKPTGAASGFPHRGIPRGKWKVHFVSSEETHSKAAKAFDGDPSTTWHSQFVKTKGAYPYDLQIDLGASVDVCGFALLPRQELQIGRIKAYEFYVSADGKDWGEAVAKGTWPDTPNLQTVRFKATPCRYVRLVPRSGIVGDRPACAIAELFVLDTKTAKARPAAAPRPAGGLALDELVLRLTGAADGDRYKLTLAALDPKTGDALAEVSRTMDAASLQGNVALVCHAQVGRGRRGGQNAGGSVTAWFRDWRVGGSKVEAHPEHAFGPILWAQHTLSRGVLKMTAQMPPIGTRDAQTVRLQVQRAGQWATVAEAPIHKLARTATFRVANWDATKDTPYRVAYALREPPAGSHAS